MLHGVLRELLGVTVAALDDEVGRVFDAYVDDRDWVLRYVVVDTGAWLTGRRVLVSPASFERIDWDQRTLAVRLSRDQVRHSPEIEPHGPPSRQYETAYFDYLGYSYYWLGPGAWGVASLPSALAEVAPPPVAEGAAAPADASPPIGEALAADSHLLSASVVAGVEVVARDGTAGELEDLLVEDSSWRVQRLSVKLREPDGMVVLVPSASCLSVSSDDRQLTLDLTLDAVRARRVVDSR